MLNYCYPASELALSVPLGVHFQSDLEQVERVTIEVAVETLRQAEGGVVDFKPTVRFERFGDFSVIFQVGLRVKSAQSRPLVTHEFLKRIHKRYDKEGIVMPYPVHALNTVQEKAKLSS